ncbi:uncharacterized protein TRIADDRAFT_58607 [Trichoplax adhaerens]|uniref:Prominin-1 n=1 Tax=Trichoplax adhaerens TaxID=10228 RepID=B3S359_TRIAD|nr:hypothetical protein TRIADDRAFT_58607 [Trichoplax adhaerens]EDV22913.1 hypothetical protein TRIADDRAFT_58607 [Trichoplax adhaerens]|eukprot:XP_002114779.1 hypothetical protein TRIADDRAFT_58607 [Trichoplax adhaerens]
MQPFYFHALLTLSLLATLSLGQSTGATTPPSGNSMTANTTTITTSSSSSLFSKLPTQDQIVTNTATTPLETGMAFFYNIARGFINAIHTQELPYGVLRELIKARTTSQLQAVWDLNYEKIIHYELVFAILGGIGIVAAFTFVIVGITFCTLRCCGMCGSEMMQARGKNFRCKGICYGIFLVIFSLLAIGGAITCFLSSAQLAETVQKVDVTLRNGLVDVTNYQTVTSNQFTILLDNDFNITMSRVRRYISDSGIETTVGIPLKGMIQNRTDPVVQILTQLSSDNIAANMTLQKINSQLSQLEANMTELNITINAIKANLTRLETACSCSSSVQFNISSLFVIFDASKMPSLQPVSDVIKNVSDRQPLKISGEINNRTAKIPKQVVNETKSARQKISTQLTSLDTIRRSALSYISFIRNFNITSYVNPAINALQKEKKEYDVYVVAGYMVYSGILMLFPGLIILGLFFGILGRKADAAPTERGLMSNAGGIFLMASVGLMFIFAFFYLFINASFFMIGGNMQRAACHPIKNGSIYRQVIDNETVWGGYPIAGFLLQNDTIPLTATRILNECQKDNSLYSTFLLAYRFNITKELDIQRLLPNITAEVDKIVIPTPNITLLSSQNNRTLQESLNNNATKINTTEIDAILSIRTTSINLVDYANRLEADTNSTSVANDVRQVAQELRILNSGKVAAINQLKTSLQTNINKLETEIMALRSDIRVLLDRAKVADNYIKASFHTDAKNLVKTIATQIGNEAKEYANYVKNKISNDVGKCFVLRNVYDNAVNVVCDFLQDAINGVWCAVGICAICFIPNIIFGVKLAKYYRRMEKEHPYDKNAMDAYYDTGYMHAEKPKMV